jgi:hypothetical protein
MKAPDWATATRQVTVGEQGDTKYVIVQVTNAEFNDPTVATKLIGLWKQRLGLPWVVLTDQEKAHFCGDEQLVKTVSAIAMKSLFWAPMVLSFEAA